MKNPHIITSDSTLNDALRRLNSLSDGNLTLIVIDDCSRLRGSLTDGDIRRALLRGVSLDAAVDAAMRADCVSVASRPSRSEAGRLLSRGIKLLPLVDHDGVVCELIDLTTYRPSLPLSALIMAGGRGERLRPATLTTPKPLLPINSRPIIDYVVDLLHDSGISDITVACRYLADQLIAHFDSTDIKCVVEDAPLGTIGAISLLGEPRFDNMLVLNCDLLTTADIPSMLEFHQRHSADITIATIPYTVQVPYAILSTDGPRVKSLEEKPVYTFYANAGIYLLSKNVIKMVTPGKRLDATDLIDMAISKQLTVVSFPLSGTWVDIGSPADFAYAEQLLAR